jgi:UPF0716 protein FxsA
MQSGPSQSRVKWLIYAILALPVAELAVFIAISTRIGFFATLLTVVGVSLIGVLMLRQQARDTSIRIILNERQMSAIDFRDAGLHRWLSALLLAVPGFITGALGGLLMIPPLRRVVTTWIGGQVRAEKRGDPGVVDLSTDDWKTLPQDRIGKGGSEH